MTVAIVVDVVAAHFRCAGVNGGGSVVAVVLAARAGAKLTERQFSDSTLRIIGIDVTQIPEASPLRPRKPPNLEIRPLYKTSLFMMRELASISSKAELKGQLTPFDYTSKSGGYNSALLPFIDQN